MAVPTIDIITDHSVVSEDARKIGEIAVNWNSLHVIIFMMFMGFCRMEKEVAAKIYYALKADSSQRDITLSVGRHALSMHNANLLERLNELFNKINKFSGVRNGAIHSITSIMQNGHHIANPYDKPPENSARKDIHMRLDSEVKNGAALLNEAASLFNDLAVSLDWRQEFLG